MAPLFHVVQQFLLQLVQGQFRPYFGGLREIEAFHTVALYHVLRIVFLADGDGLFSQGRDGHAKDPRKFLHDESALLGTDRLTFQLSLDANKLVSRRNWRNRYQIEDDVILQTRDLLVRCCLPTRHLGQAYGSLKVFGTRSDSPPTEQLDCVLVLV